MNRVPKRSSLLAETLSVLRDGIRMSRWVDRFPSERELAVQLQISRPTVRSALGILQREGRVRIAQGRRSQILERPKKLQPQVNPNLIALLSPVGLDQVQPSTLLRIDELRGHFHDVGVEFHVYIRPRCFTARPNRMLQSIVSEIRAGCWILIRTNRAVQEWFVANQVPCVISGMTYDGIQIPCIDTHQYAISRHAIGLFRSRGHTRIGFILQERCTAGDEAAIAGFTAPWRESQIETRRPLVMRHDGSLDQIRNTLESVAFRKYNPTALFVGDPMCCLAVVTHLQRKGKRIPEDIAVTCRSWDKFLDYVTPSIANYSRFETIMEHTVFRTALEVLRGESLSKRKKLLMPEFVPGESLG